MLLAITGTTVFGQITLSFQTTNAVCPNACNGSITVIATGGTPPYSYLWNDSLMSTTSTVSGLCAGNYIVTVTDSQGNSSFGTASLTEPTPIVITKNLHYPSSPSNNDGYIETSVTGGVPPYSYTWSNNQNTPNIYNLSSGVYKLTVVDANLCFDTIIANLFSNNPTYCNSYFYYYLDSLNSFPPYGYQFINQSNADSSSQITSFLWNFGDGTTSTLANPNHIFNSGVFNVCLTITTSNGCTSSYCDTIVINTNPCQLYANIFTFNPTTIGGNDGYIETTINGGFPPYTFYWSNGATTQNVYNLTSGLYTLNVVDSNGCQNTFYATLYEPYDTLGGPIVDTLYSLPYDTCLNFIPDSFYIASYTIIDTNHVIINWVFVNGNQTSTLNIEYTYSTFGNNLVVLTINCSSMKILTTYQSYINLRNTSSVSGLLNANLYSVYPNPFNDIIHITSPSINESKSTLSITNITGKQVYMKSISNLTNFIINTSQLPSGMYILSIETKDGIYRKQLIK